MRAFDPKGFGLAVDALSSDTLAIDGIVERAKTVQEHAHASTSFGIEILDTTLAFSKLLMVARLARAFGMEKWAAIALGLIAIGMSKRIGGSHAQTFGAQGNFIRIEVGFGMGIEGNSGNTMVAGTGFVGISGISSDMDRKEANSGDSLPSEQLDLFLASFLLAQDYRQAELTTLTPLRERIEQVVQALIKTDQRIALILDDAQVLLNEQGDITPEWLLFFEQFVEKQHQATLFLASREWPGWPLRGYHTVAEQEH